MTDGERGVLPRTVLEQRIRERGETLLEFTEYAERYAREHGLPGTLSLRNLQRLVAGRRDDGGQIRRVMPATARLIEHIFGVRRIAELLEAPTIGGADDDATLELRQRLSASGRVDAVVIGLISDQLGVLRQLDRQLGGIVAHDEVTTKAAQVSRLLSHSLSPSVRTDLSALLSELCALAGWQALDLGRATDAWEHHERGKAVSADAALAPFEAHTAAEQAFVLLDVYRTTDAIALLEGTIERVGTRAAPLLRSWLSAALGEALAADGQRDASLRAFDLAADRLPDDTTANDGPYVALDPVHLARWRGHALARLGEPEAIGVLSDALERLDSTFTRAETALRVDLAMALCATGEVEEARRHAECAAHLAEDIGSARQRHRMKGLQRALTVIMRADSVTSLPVRPSRDASP